ncbi:MAG TPA: hypothetical protein VE487_20550 [Ilumatobacter sp.]|jgi:hypothetical protein|nr:hypothetical protein [Ilumatobacter sp.]
MVDVAPAVRTLRLVAVHVVARARQQATGRFSLRVTPGGFGTPEFGPDSRRVRVAHGTLIVESDAPGAASSTAHPIAGSSMRELADVAGVDLRAALDVGQDTPDMGDAEAPHELDQADAGDAVEWLADVAAALDRVLAAMPAGSGASVARLWPEHFDVAIDVAARPDVRVNLGGSPGDSFSGEPYLYVGPWTADRPGDDGFWNAPFGAGRTRSQLDAGDLVGSAAAFLLEGLHRLQR